MQNPLKNLNVIVILAGLLIIILGYVLMSTEKFIDANEFSLSLYVSPPLIIIGHAVIVAGIILRGKKAVEPDDSKFGKATHN